MTEARERELKEQRDLMQLEQKQVDARVLGELAEADDRLQCLHREHLEVVVEVHEGGAAPEGEHDVRSDRYHK